MNDLLQGSAEEGALKMLLYLMVLILMSCQMMKMTKNKEGTMIWTNSSNKIIINLKIRSH